MIFSKKLIFALLTIINIKQAMADVWQVTQEWSDEKEIEYQAWLKKNAKVDIFLKPYLDDKVTKNPYFGLTTDCADTVYSLRVIFSYEQGLPWAIKNPNNPSKLITQESKKYDRFPEGPERLKKLLIDLYDVVGTKSLENDTYPISINDIHPGVIIATSHINHHSWTIADIDQKGNPRLIFNSTVGKASGPKLQQRYSWPNPYWVFQADEKLSDPKNPDSPKVKVPVFVNDSYAGLRYWIPVAQLKENKKLLPKYSNDQFSIELSKFNQTLQKKLANIEETPQEILERLLVDACEDIKQRIAAVSEAEYYKKTLAYVIANTTKVENVIEQTKKAKEKNPDYELDKKSQLIIDIYNEYKLEQNKPENLQCLSAKQYDLLSTPSRDKRLFDGLMRARAYYSHFVENGQALKFSKNSLAKFNKIFPHIEKSALEETEIVKDQSSKIDKFSFCTQTIGQSKIDLAEMKRRIFLSYISPNPNEDIIGRWGGRGREKSHLAEVCQNFDGEYSPYDLEQTEEQAKSEFISISQ